MQVPFELATSTVAVFRVGSHSHGTYIPSTDMLGVDDVDLMVIVMQPASLKLGPKPFDNASYKHGNLDVVIYDWGKWLSMIEKQNPNVIGTLWLEHEDMYFPDEDSPATNLMFYRRRFLSKKMYPAFSGYAAGQLHKMTHNAHQGYMGHKRKMLVEQFGYDVKNASHMIRLQRMCLEALTSRKLRVRRFEDSKSLIEIKKGQWTLDEVLAEGAYLKAACAEAYDKSLLRDAPDEALLRRITIAGYMEWWKKYPEEYNRSTDTAPIYR